MRKLGRIMLVPAAVLAAACGRNDRADDALRNDLALASQAQPYMPQQFMSPTEAGYNPYNPYAPQGYMYPQQQPQYGYPQRVQTTTSAPARRTSTRSSGTIYRAPAPVTVKRNTKRDAVIGAAAGAAIGVATSRDKLKGAIIGAAAGGLLGGIVGHRVDVQKY
jgi:hypothetical protein